MLRRVLLVSFVLTLVFLQWVTMGGLGSHESPARLSLVPAAQAFVQAHLTVPGATAADWLDAGQCLDCEQAAFNYRPGGSAQYMMALSNFDERSEDGRPRRFRFGFMASSDNHFARPGTGYKEVHRKGFSESSDQIRDANPLLTRALQPEPEDPVSFSRPYDPSGTARRGLALFELERQSSFFLTGGLIATHAEGRDRAAVWDALQRREVYGTTGPRMLLWFDLMNPPGRGGAKAQSEPSLPMGSEVEMPDAPIFRARAVGSFEQQPGCPDDSTNALGPERLEHICKGECYNPSDVRRPITRIEVVRIRPQTMPGEAVAGLIDDPWRVFRCDADPAGCAVTFEDKEFATLGRDALYYVRAYESPIPAVNAAGLNCERDTSGRCIATRPCGTDPSSDCLADYEPRAWSSPISIASTRGSLRSDREPSSGPPATQPPARAELENRMKSSSYLDPHPKHRDRWSLRRSRDFLSGVGHSLPAFWSDSKFLVFDADIDPAVARAWLPPGLRPSWLLRAYPFRTW